MLFIDNFKAHKTIPEMKSVKVEFLLQSMMSKLQSMNQCIIQSFKIKFLNKVVKEVLSKINERNKPNANVIEAMRMAQSME